MCEAQDRSQFLALPTTNSSLGSVSREALLAWYRTYKRDLPWRQTLDPYAIWVSEVMLQQTQVATVIPYFERWMTSFPTIASLASADEQDVLRVWQGLGYYRRAKMLLAGARFVVAQGLPSSALQWLSVPGVGRYTACAISSIAFEEPVPVVDGNVERVFARLTGCELTKPALGRKAWRWAEANVERGNAGEWNQALMELGATVCRPTGPLCEKCPLAQICEANAKGSVGRLPTPSAKPRTVKLRRSISIPICDGHFGVRQIQKGQWWEGMWEFPEGSEGIILGQIKHTVTHHRITLTVYWLSCKVKRENLDWVSREELQRLPMPAAQRRALALYERHAGVRDSRLEAVCLRA